MQLNIMGLVYVGRAPNDSEATIHEKVKVSVSARESEAAGVLPTHRILAARGWGRRVTA